MLPKSALAALLLCSAAPVIAQAQGPTPEQQAAIARTAEAFGQCVGAGVERVDATVTPEAGAAAVLSGCDAQRTQLLQAVQALIAAMPADEQARANEQVRTHMAASEAEIAEAIRRKRAAAAAAQ